LFEDKSITDQLSLNSIIRHNEFLLPIGLFLVGLLAGSFLNACIYRIPRRISLIAPYRSFCPQCRHTLAWWQNIPLISYAILKGRCNYCRNKISYQYPFVELLTGVLTVLWFKEFGISVHFFFYLPLLYALIAISIIDIQHRVIPNPILVFLVISGISLNVLLKVIPWQDVLWGVLAAGMVMFAIQSIGYLLFRKESLGMGDVKLAAVIGSFIGWQLFLGTLFLASLIALITVLMLKLFKRDLTMQKIPFAPFLSAGALAALLWGMNIWNWYVSRIL